MPNSTLYLIVYHDKVDPAHWRLLLASPGSETVGTMLEVVSSFYGGFEHKISHGYDEAYSKSKHSKIPLGVINATLAAKVEQCATGTDPNGVGCNLPVEILREYNCQTWTKVCVERLVKEGFIGSEALSVLRNAPRN